MSPAMRAAASTIARARERVCSGGVAPGSPRSSAQPRIAASGARKSWATTFTSSLFIRSSSTSRAFVASRASYSSAVRSRMPIPSASVSSVIRWPLSKPPGRSSSTRSTAATSPPERIGTASALRLPGACGARPGSPSLACTVRFSRSAWPASPSPSGPADERLLAAHAAAGRGDAEERLVRHEHRHQARSERLLDAAGRRLEDPLAGEEGRGLAEDGVDEGQLLAALALGLERHRVRAGDRELAREAGQVLEVLVGEGRRARPPRRVEDAVEHRLALLAVEVGEGHAQDPRDGVLARDEVLVPLGLVHEHGQQVARDAAGDALAEPEHRPLGGRRGGLARPHCEQAQHALALLEAKDRRVVGLDEPPGLLRRADEQALQVAQRRRLEAEVVQGRHLAGQVLGRRLALRPAQRESELSGERREEARLLLVESARAAARDREDAERVLPGPHGHRELARGVGAAGLERRGQPQRPAQRLWVGGRLRMADLGLDREDAVGAGDEERDTVVAEVALHSPHRQVDEPRAPGHRGHVADERRQPLEAARLPALALEALPAAQERGHRAGEGGEDLHVAIGEARPACRLPRGGR